MAEPAAAATLVGSARRTQLWVAALAGAASVGIVGAVVTYAVVSHGPGASALPLLHGQTSWPAGERPAPRSVPRGKTALVVFARGCAPCDVELRRVVRRLPAAERPVLIHPRAAETAAYGVRSGRRVVLLIDRHGDERTGYAFPLAPGFLEGDLRTLAQLR